MTRAVVVGLAMLAACADAPTAPKPTPICLRYRIPVENAAGHVVAHVVVLSCAPGARDTVNVP